MIKLDKINVDAQEWELIADHFTDHNVIQTGAYGDAKVSSSGWSVERLIFKEDEKVVSIIEWPEKIEKKIKDRLEITFYYQDEAESRKINIKGYGKWKDFKLNAI